MKQKLIYLILGFFLGIYMVLCYDYTKSKTDVSSQSAYIRKAGAIYAEDWNKTHTIAAPNGYTLYLKPAKLRGTNDYQVVTVHFVSSNLTK